MRAMVGVVSLLVVLAIVGLLAAKQLKSGAVSVSVSAPSAEPGTAAAADGGAGSNAAVTPLSGTPAQQSQQLQQRVQGDVAKAFDAAADARREAVDK